MTDWIVVPNWPKFQHYHDRSPTWIKLYLDLRSRDEWRHLTLAARGLLVSIWLEYAASNGQLRALDGHLLGPGKSRRSTLDSLLETGFIQVSSRKPLALARAREETETEKKISKRKTDKGRQRAERWIANGAAAGVPDESLADVISDEFGITEPELVYTLVQKALERKAAARA